MGTKISVVGDKVRMFISADWMQSCNQTRLCLRSDDVILLVMEIKNIQPSVFLYENII